MYRYCVSVESGHRAEPKFSATMLRRLAPDDVFHHAGRSYRALRVLTEPANGDQGAIIAAPADSL